MKPKDLLKLNRPPNILIYGRAGTFKTALVSQASNGYLFDFDDGMRTAATLQDKFTPLRQGIEFDTFVDKNPKQPKAFMNAKKKLLEISALCAKGQWKYDACIIDSLTGMCKSCQLQVLGSAGNSFKRPEIQHWGMMVNEIENMLTILRSLNVLTIVTAHIMSDEIDAVSKVFPMSITKKHGENKLTWLFDEVLYSRARSKGQGKYDMIVTGQGTGSIEARTRSGLPKNFVHNDCGLVGVLKAMGYSYGKKKD